MAFPVKAACQILGTVLVLLFLGWVTTLLNSGRLTFVAFLWWTFGVLAVSVVAVVAYSIWKEHQSLPRTH
jgi:hypothetical protein